MLKEVIKVEPGRVVFPTLLGCIVCGGVRGVAGIDDKDLAYQVALIQHGYYLRAWEKHNVLNKYQFPYKCICECDHSFEVRSFYMFEHCYTCRKCGWSGTVDSSG